EGNFENPGSSDDSDEGNFENPGSSDDQIAPFSAGPDFGYPIRIQPDKWYQKFLCAPKGNKDELLPGILPANHRSSAEEDWKVAKIAFLSASCLDGNPSKSRASDCRELRHRFKRGYLDRILASDEKPMLCGNGEAGKQWLERNELGVLTSKPELHRKKVLL
ncbi:unnamed protein product, partial [Heligmosomoides polygyrus]|uniref:DBR1 domain-containing protein n=1 Tax=Heligmosomoides polygyrus TaxID=6339 RepID=A0A183GDR5_HELPZ